MSSTLWQLERNLGHAINERWNATVDLCWPSDGLAFSFAHKNGTKQDSSTWNLLGVILGEGATINASRIDAYVRGSDLVTTYADAPPRQLRAQIYWRQLAPAEFSPQHAPQIVASFDLIFSVNTPLLDCDPEAAVRSLTPAGDILNLREAGKANWRAESVDSPELEAESPGQATGCFIARPAATSLSYIEMVHPADYTSSSITIGDSAPPRVRILHQFFRERLEKGVILRARMRAAITSRDQDDNIAIDAYQRFAAMEPPLTV